MATEFATLRNRNTDASCRVKLGRTGKLVSVGLDAYNNALRKLGHGPIASNESFVVVNKAGDMRGAVDRFDDRG
jgi:hypothetical protein